MNTTIITTIISDLMTDEHDFLLTDAGHVTLVKSYETHDVEAPGNALKMSTQEARKLYGWLHTLTQNGLL